MTEEMIRARLAALQVPPSLIGGISVRPEGVTVVLEAESSRAAQLEPLRAQIEADLRQQPGLARAQVVITATAAPHQHGHAHPHPAPKAPVAPEVRAIVAVASGKGGVGKSTVAVNLALAAHQNGLRVGLLDADIYGPSLPMLLGLPATPPPLDEHRQMIPPIALGIKAMSIGFMVDPESALIWRGPMVHSAINQMLRDVAWGPLDLLIVDMPPGTGDAQLTMAQNGRLAGAVIVSTPQDMALIDARRGVAMFRKVGVPVLGVIENMSSYCCPKCGHEAPVFGHGGAKAEAEKLGVAFLGEIPLDMALRVASDTGVPVTHGSPGSVHAQRFRDIAAAVWASVEPLA